MKLKIAITSEFALDDIFIHMSGSQFILALNADSPNDLVSSSVISYISKIYTQDSTMGDLLLGHDASILIKNLVPNINMSSTPPLIQIISCSPTPGLTLKALLKSNVFDPELRLAGLKRFIHWATYANIGDGNYVCASILKLDMNELLTGMEGSVMDWAAAWSLTMDDVNLREFLGRLKIEDVYGVFNINLVQMEPLAMLPMQFNARLNEV